MFWVDIFVEIFSKIRYRVGAAISKYIEIIVERMKLDPAFKGMKEEDFEDISDEIEKYITRRLHEKYSYQKFKNSRHSFA